MTAGKQSLLDARSPKLPPNGRARKCAFWQCRRPTVTDPLCTEHRSQSWMRQMLSLEAR